MSKQEWYIETMNNTEGRIPGGIYVRDVSTSVSYKPNLDRDLPRKVRITGNPYPSRMQYVGADNTPFNLYFDSTSLSPGDVLIWYSERRNPIKIGIIRQITTFHGEGGYECMLYDSDVNAYAPEEILLPGTIYVVSKTEKMEIQESKPIEPIWLPEFVQEPLWREEDLVKPIIK